MPSRLTTASCSAADSGWSVLDAPHSSLDAAAGALSHAIAMLDKYVASNTPSTVTTSQLAAAGLLCSHALTSVATHLTAHAAAAAQQRTLGDIHGEISTANGQSSSAASASSAAAPATGAAILSASRLHSLLSTLLSLHSAARSWETATRSGRHQSSRTTRSSTSRRALSRAPPLPREAQPPTLLFAYLC